MNKSWIHKKTYTDENGQLKLEFHYDGDYRRTYLHTFSTPPNYFEGYEEIDYQLEGCEFGELDTLWVVCNEVEMIGHKRWEDGKPCYEEVE